MSMPDEFYHELDMAEARADMRDAEVLLSKLSVADLRVLARKYWKLDKAEAAQIRKADLVRDLACENGEDILNEMWKAKRRSR